MSLQYLDEDRVHDRSLELAATAVDFDLTTEEARELEAHLTTCTVCARRAAALHTDASALTGPLQILPSARVDAAVHAAIAGRGGRPQRVIVAIAAILILAAFLGAVAVGSQLLRNREPLLTTVVPTPTAPVAVVSPDPSAAVPVVGNEWGMLDFDEGSAGGSIETVAFDGNALVGGGRGGCIPLDREPTACYVSAYTSVPGQRWSRTPDHPGLQVGLAVGTSSPPAGIFDIAVGQQGKVAIGYGDDGSPRIWIAPSGGAWTPVEVDLASSGVARVAAIETSPSGYIIVGWVRDAGGGGAHAAAWTSPDGQAWDRALDSAAMDVGSCFLVGEDSTCGGMLGVVATPTGFVAVGADHATARGTEPGRPAAWTSPDGRPWTRAFTGLEFVGSLSDVALGGPGLVAVGTVCPPQCFEPTAGAVAATSVDGSTWRFEPITGAVGPQRLASTGGRLFAVSVRNQDVDPRAELQLWRTDDGAAWQRVASLPSIPDATFYGGADIAASGDRLVIAGWLTTTGSGEARNFSYSSPPTAAPPETPPNPSGSPDPSASVPVTAPSVSDVRPVVAALPASGEATGLRWSLADTDPRAYGSAITNGPAGWLYAVSAQYDRPPTFGLRLSEDLKTWSDVTPQGRGAGCVSLAASRTRYLSLCNGLARSSDALTWENVDAPATEGLLKGEAKQFYSDGSTFLATTGFYPSDDGIWMSPDGANWNKVHLPGAARVIIDTVVARASGGYFIAGRAGADEAAFGTDKSLPAGSKNPGREAMWQSADGATWTAIPLGNVFDGARITGLAVDGPGGGIVAVGHFGEVPETGLAIQAAVWRSSDGVTWQHLIGPAFDLREGDVGDARVVGLPDRWLVFASRPRTVDGKPAMTGIGVAAGSEDGIAWWSTDPIWGDGSSPYAIDGLAVADGRLVALDNTLVDSATVDPSARIWVSP